MTDSQYKQNMRNALYKGHAKMIKREQIAKEAERNFDTVNALILSTSYDKHSTVTGEDALNVIVYLQTAMKRAQKALVKQRENYHYIQTMYRSSYANAENKILLEYPTEPTDLAKDET